MEENNKEIVTQNNSNDEIDLIEIAAKLWAKRRFIIKTTAIFTAIGLFIAIFTPNEYTSSTIMVPQTGEKKTGGSLSGLAAMAGINLETLISGEVLSPTVYSKILENVNFQRELIYHQYNVEKVTQPISYYEYASNNKYAKFSMLSFLKKYTFNLPETIKRSLKRNSFSSYDSFVNDSTPIKKLSITEFEIIEDLIKKLEYRLFVKDGYLSLTFTSYEPRLTAELLQRAQILMQQYITTFKIEKVRNNLSFVENSYIDAKKNFEAKQEELARFRDFNINLNTAMAKTQEEKLMSEYNLLLNVYTELAKQKEQAKIAVTETTPIFSIIKPVTIPTKKSGPKRTALVAFFAFLGLFSGVCWVQISPIIANIDLSRKTIK